MVLELQQRDLEPAEALQDIKTLQKNPDMFLITVDAAQENDGRTIKLAGVNRSLLKPIHLDELTEAVSAYLQKRR
jgi:response regulator of citrate/malate metabolism